MSVKRRLENLEKEIEWRLSAPAETAPTPDPYDRAWLGAAAYVNIPGNPACTLERFKFVREAMIVATGFDYMGTPPAHLVATADRPRERPVYMGEFLNDEELTKITVPWEPERLKRDEMIATRQAQRLGFDPGDGTPPAIG